MAVRPRSCSRLRCWAGDSSSSKTTVSASTAPAQLGQLLGLAPPDEGGRVRPVAALHDPGDHVGPGRVDQEGQLVEGRPRPPRRRCPAGPRPPGRCARGTTGRSGVPGEPLAHVAHTMRVRRPTSATLRTGPARGPGPRAPHPSESPRAGPPGLWTVTARADQAPGAGGGGGGAAPGATGQGLAHPALPDPDASGRRARPGRRTRR